MLFTCVFAKAQKEHKLFYENGIVKEAEEAQTTPE